MLRTLAWVLSTILLLASLAACSGSSNGGQLDTHRDDGVSLADAIASPADVATDTKPLPDARADAPEMDVPAPLDDADSSDTPPSDVPDAEPHPDIADAADAADTPDRPDAPETTDVDAGPPPCPPEADEMLSEAHAWLEGAQPVLARELFEKASALCPQSAEARFGAALAQMVDSVELLMSLASLSSQLEAYGKTDGGDQSQNEWLGDMLHDTFGDLAAGFHYSLERLDGLADAQLDFAVTRMPIYNVTRPMLVYEGRFDRGDVHLMRAVAQLAIFALDVLRTQDLHTDLLTAIGIFQDELDGLAMGPLVFSAMGYLLAKGPTFLDVHPVDGAEIYAEAGRMLAGVSESLELALEWMRDEPDGGEDDVQVTRLLTNTAGAERISIRAGAKVSDEGELTSFAFSIDLPPELPEAFRLIAESVDNPGTLVTWKDGPVWLVSAAVTVAIKAGIIDELNLGGLVITPQMVSVKTLAGIINNLVALPFAFDFGTLFQQPTGLRAFLPTPTQGDEYGLVAEWECADEVAGDGWPNGPGALLCAGAAGLVDTPHFVETPYETLADGHATAFPVLAFADPTWGGLLHVNRAALGLSETPGYELADQLTINAGLAVGLAPVLDLLGNL